VSNARADRRAARLRGDDRRLRVVLGTVGALLLLLAIAVPVLAASPTPGPGGDPRSSGQGPGLVGDPAFAILAVALIATGAIVATLVYVRLTGGPRT
jgi:hypothetical protein